MTYQSTTNKVSFELLQILMLIDKIVKELVLCTAAERSEVQCNYEKICCSSEKDFILN
jgi:hypothetical protein